MAYTPIQVYHLSLDRRKKNIKQWRMPDEDKRAILRFLDELALGKVNKGHQISLARQAKYLDMLRIPLESFGKPTSRLTVKDVEAFEKKLCSGEIQSQKGRPYSSSTKADIRAALKVFLRWKLGKRKGDDLTDWLDTRVPAKTPDYLSEAQVTALWKGCKSASERFLIAVLFDTGARASEFLNIRYEDIRLPGKGDNYVKITLKEEYSKTIGRTISLFWDKSLEAVQDYIREREAMGIRADEPVFNGRYDQARCFLNRLGLRILKRPIHFHLFRHSSATYYASKLNRQQLCCRYGWTFSSEMPDVYISRAGMDNKELDEKFTSTTLEEVRIELRQEKLQSRMAMETIEVENRRLHEQLERLTQLVERFTGKAIPQVAALEEQIQHGKTSAPRKPVA